MSLTSIKVRERNNMNFNFENIEELKKEAISFKRNYPVRYLCSGKVCEWAPDKEFLEKWQHCYSSNNGTLAYVEGDTVYVIPSMSNAKELVKYSDNDMEKFNKMSSFENNFFVPLSNGETLENYELQAHWEFLRAVQHEDYRR